MSDTAEIVHFPTQERRPRVNSWRWNELEEDALDGLPHDAQVLYLRVMRKHMDYATGITGRVRKISYTQMREVLEYHPPKHSREKPVTYSKDQLKRLVQKLVDAGLIERLHCTEKGVAPMEVRLPMASCDADEPRHESATATPPRKNPRGCGAGEGNSATREPRKNDEPRHPSGSGNPNPLTTFGGGASDELELQEPPAEPRPKPAAKRAAYPEAFEAAWATYPKRAGNNPKKSAYRAWAARRQEGVPTEIMQAAVERYAAFIRTKGDERTEFVMQGQKFFGPNAEFDNDWALPASRQPSRTDGRLGMAQPKPQGTYTPTDMDNLPAWMRDPS